MVPTSNTVDLDRRLPNSELVIYPDAGHGGIFQYHEEFVRRALEFLEGHLVDATCPRRQRLAGGGVAGGNDLGRDGDRGLLRGPCAEIQTRG